MTERKYRIEVTEAQARVMRDACELLARIALGQFHTIVEHAMHSPTADLAVARDHLDSASRALGQDLYGPNFSPGITNPRVPNRSREAWDLHQVIRHRLAWDKTPEGNTTHVHFDTPMQVGDEPLPKIESIEEDT